MASSITHALSGLAIASGRQGVGNTKVRVLAAICAVLPDLDALGRPFGFGDIGFLGGHRALTHSLGFALVLGALASLLVAGQVRGNRARARIWLCLALSTASHGVIDLFTSYGEGVQLLAPVSAARFKAPVLLMDGPVDELMFLTVPLLLVIRFRRQRVNNSGE